MYFRFGNNKLTNWGMSFYGGEDGSDVLPTLLQTLIDVYPEEIEGDADLLKEPIKGDFIVREEVAAEKVVSRLEEILRKECRMPVKLAFREVERKVIVATGKYAFKPLKQGRENEVEIYGKQLVENSGAGGGGGTFPEFLSWVGMFIERRIVGELDEMPKLRMSWNYHRRSPSTAEERREDTDPEAVLKHVTEQTGLTFKEAKRKVRVLFVERAELK
jgi:hypothetical protein